MEESSISSEVGRSLVWTSSPAEISPDNLRKQFEVDFCVSPETLLILACGNLADGFLRGSC